MKIFLPVFLYIIISLSTGTRASYSQTKDSVLLRLRLTKGDTYSLSSNTVIKARTNGKAFIQMIGAEFLVSVAREQKENNFLLNLKLEHYSLIIYSDSGKPVFALDTKDSNRRMNGNDSVLFESATKTIGLVFWEELNEYSGLMRTNLDTVIKNLQTDKAIAGLVKAITEQNLTAISFSANPVNIGETWKGVTWKNTEGKVLSANSYYTLNAMHDSLAEISVSSKDWGNVPDGNELNAMITGNFKIDMTSGLPIKSHFITKLKASGTVDMAGDMETTINIKKR